MTKGYSQSNCKYPYPYPGPVFPVPYPASPGQIFEDTKGNVYQISNNPNFPNNPEALEVTVYKLLSPTFAACETFGFTFISSISAAVGFEDILYNVEKTSAGLILYPMLYPASSGQNIVLTSLVTNPYKCGNFLSPKSTLQLSTNGMTLNSGYSSTLVIYGDLWLGGSAMQQGSEGYYFTSSEFNRVTGNYVGSFNVHNSNGDIQYSLIEAYDGHSFYSSCYCGSNQVLVQNTTGLRYYNYYRHTIHYYHYYVQH